MRPAFLLALLSAALGAQQPVRTHVARPTSPAIDTGDLRTRLYIVADDSMEGRDAGRRGGRRMEEYLAREAARLGLMPAGDHGTYFQAIPLVMRRPDLAGTLATSRDTLRTGVDLLPMPRLGDTAPYGGTLSADGVPTVYGGRIGSADMLPVSAARGRLVIFAPPVDAAGRTTVAFWLRDDLSRYAGIAAGVGVVMWGAGGAPLAALAVTRPSYEDPAKPYPVRLAALALSASAAERLLGAPLSGLAAGAVGPLVSGRAGFIDAPTEVPARNVAAILRGTDPKLRATYVAVGAHLDHVGMAPRPLDHDSVRAFNTVVRPRGADSPARAATAEETVRITAILDSLRRLRPARLDSIFNGADDDGSGSVLVMEIAESFARAKVRPRRSLLFLWHTAEEKGLLGAQYFSDHPTVPRDSIVAEIDMDATGRGTAGDPEASPPGALIVLGTRRLSTELGDLAERVNAMAKHGFAFDYAYDKPGDPTNGYCRSDHYMYARYGIPIAFFSAGPLHRDYHQLTDEPQYIDYERMARVGRYVRDLVGAVANLGHRPVVDKPKPDPNGKCQQ